MTYHPVSSCRSLLYSRLRRPLSLIASVLIGAITWKSLLLLSRFVLPIGPTTLSDEESRGVITNYINAALRNAQFRQTSETVYAAVPGIEGAWGCGRTTSEALEQLRRSLELTILTSVFERLPLPAFGSASLKISLQSVDQKREPEVVYDISHEPASNPLKFFDDSTT